MKLILLRHGESQWNLENRFTGWKDVSLTEAGIAEANFAGNQLLKANIKIKSVYTSLLNRATETTDIVTDIINFPKEDIQYDWRLNERHYGSLTGLNKDETKKKIGKEQFKKYRRSWDVAPPLMSNDSNYYKNFSPLNSGIPENKIPLTESLKNTYDRVVPFYDSEIKKNLKNGNNILISAHGNSLRALCKYLFRISDKKINELEIPTGNPLLINLDKENEITDCKYLDKERAKDLVVF